jgi:osmotically-inducible protein OsmY
MGINLKPLRTLACLGLAVSALGVAGCRTSTSTQASTQWQADRQLALDVADNLRRAPDSTFPDVAVSADHGQVILRGYVPNEALRAQAVQIAAQMPGVTGVVNDLAIKPNAPVGAATPP